MASHIIEIDEDIEIKLLLNFSINKVSDLPNNVCEILNGRYEDIINNELSTFIEAIKNGDNLEEIIHNSLSETHTHLSWLCTGIASLLYFVQCNWTGPPIDKDIDWLKTRRNEALNHLSLHDGCNINVRKPELIYLSKKIFSDVDLQLKYKSCIWWLFRATLLHQHILDENTGVLFEETENLITEINNLNILEHPLCKLLFNLEAGTFYLYYKRSQNSEKHLEHAQKIAGLKLNLEGAMGKRTKYQQEEKPQLYLKIEINKDTFPSIDCENVPRSLSLNDFDDLKLDCIEFSEPKEETKLGMIEEAIILGKYVQLQLCQPTYELTDEEIRPYLIPTARRMDLFFASGMRPIWMLEEKWANLMFSFGDVKTALEVFIKLELWEDVIVCYNVLNLKHKAVEIIEQEISKKPTVKLWCLLGDATGDVSHYEVAWKLSNEKSSRVQKHWGLYYFAKKNYVEAIPHLKLSVELNNIQEDVWFRLGYAALQIEDWKLAAMAYKRYCSLEQFAFEAWNNLAKAYIKLGDKTTAWKFLQDAIASCYDCWQVWDNLMIVSIDLGHFSEVIRCYHRILDLKSNHLDVQVLQILTNAIVNNINDANGNPASRLLQNSLELFGRITSNILNNPDIWRMYAELVVLKKTDVDEERAAQYLQKAYRFITSNPWSHSEAATLKVLDLCCDLAQAYLRCTTDIAVIKKRKMLGSAKLSLLGVVKKVKEQEWSNTNIIEQLIKVEEYLATITNELEQIKPA
ncbi:TTC27 protein, partial [Acromyrmex heyeri]